MSYLYEPLHPSLLRLIGGVAKAAEEARIPVTVCGEMAGEPMIAPVLLGLGIRELSMSAVSVPEIKATIRALTVEDARQLVKRADKLSTAAEVRAMVSEWRHCAGLRRLHGTGRRAAIPGDRSIARPRRMHAR